MGCGYRNAPGYFCTSTHHTLSDGVFTYTYSAAGQLVRAQSVTATLGYTYTADGLRVAQSSNGAGTTFAWDWATPVPELLSSGATRYLLGAETLGQWDGAAWTYVLPDALGSVRQTVDGAGAVTASREWSPYGAEVGGAQAGLGYTGEWQDADVGLVYLRARWYQAETGRFTTEDPWPAYARFPRSQHLYNYAWADPINLFDPSGRQVQTLVDCELGEICYTGTTGPYNHAFPAFTVDPPNARENRCAAYQARQQAKMAEAQGTGILLSPTLQDVVDSALCGGCQQSPQAAMKAHEPSEDTGVLLVYKKPGYLRPREEVYLETPAYEGRYVWMHEECPSSGCLFGPVKGSYAELVTSVSSGGWMPVEVGLEYNWVTGDTAVGVQGNWGPLEASLQHGQNGNQAMLGIGVKSGGYGLGGRIGFEFDEARHLLVLTTEVYLTQKGKFYIGDQYAEGGQLVDMVLDIGYWDSSSGRRVSGFTALHNWLNFRSWPHKVAP